MTNTIKSLVKMFGEQAVVDEIFRNNKIWFNSQDKDDKWDELKREARINGVSMTEKELREEF